MECEICFESLTALIDRELNREEESEMEAHLEQCSRCREEQQTLLSSYQLIEQISDFDFTTDLWPPIHSQISNMETETLPLISTLRSLFTLPWVPATTTLVGAIGLALFFSYQQDVQTTRQKLHDYVQQREQVKIKQTSGDQIITPLYPNPFAIRGRSYSENPFRPE